MYTKTPIYPAFRGKGFRPGVLGGPVNRIVKYTNLYINPGIQGKRKGPGKPGDTVYRGPGKSGFYCNGHPSSSFICRKCIPSASKC